ncbi:4-hydroxythreonine-4-phosphate dehydrogenase PdxA [Hydrogenophaga atypica]|uniref:4-hydroxythreonine-4-phosphate dehydrogenase PdxA n=1 Tax=Hydrogenophaga atypica TaxID=249409 RepID=A0ABW2QGX0_9BURK
MSASLPLLVTMGDPAGVGPELIAMLFRDRPDLAQRCVVAGDAATMARARVCLGCDAVAMPLVQATQVAEPAPWGRVSAHAGRAAADCIEWATREALAGRAAGVVTAPIHKEALAAAGVPFPGHTEMLQALAAEHLGVPVARLPVRMMLANPELKTVLVSIHVSLRQAIEAVTHANVLETLRITAAHWARLRLAPPRIAVAGLNPHAGEGGLFGREEIEVIAPAVAQARAEGIEASGPHAPDTVFMRAREGSFDVVVAMYHDQGLIPVKYMGLAHGVNVTLGLPLLRTSPDHGTAFDLAGTGRADPSSLIAAVELAAHMSGR